MSGAKAGIEKDKGNAAFKAGDFSTAVGHYSAAILNDRDDFTLPLNRAAAYLKLGKNEDAAKDCSTVLSLNPSNMKALFRRGQATAGLQMCTDAQKDFEAALKIEPNNQAVKDELEKLRNKPPVKGKLAPPKVLETPTGVRRRVPIKIIESESLSSPPQITELSNPESIVTPTTTEPPSEPPSSSDVPKTSQDAKRVHDEAKLPARVGGGIFRASGKNTIFAPRGELETKERENSAPTFTSKSDFPSSSMRTTPASSINEKSVTTLFDLNKTWLSLTTSSDRFQLINRVSPSAYPSFFKTSLEPSLLISIVQTYLDVMSSEPDAVPRVKESMEGFLYVPRISTITLFLSRKEKEIVLRVLEKLDDEALSNNWRGILKS